MGYNYTSINVKPEQHEQLKRISSFKKVNITQVGVEMAEAYIKQFMEENGEIMAEMEELENRMAQLRVRFKGK